MSRMIEIRVPDIGDFTDVPVIEVLVKEGDTVEKDQSLITLESDKATMEVPSPAAGRIVSLAVQVDDRVSEGMPIAQLESTEDVAEAPAETPPREAAAQGGPGADTSQPAADDRSAEAPADSIEAGDEDTSTGEFDCDVLVLGSGPGGYTAAFRAADLGLRTVLVERYPTLGGVCLNVGCIPSKALLHTAAILDETAAMAEHGVVFGRPEIQLEKLRAFKDGVVKKLTGGLAGMADKRGVEVVQGSGRFTGAHALAVRGADGSERSISFAHAIIAAGSQSIELPGIPWGDARVMDSTDALELEEIPRTLLVIGGGIIGLEMACVYSALGSRVTVVELTPQLMPGADPDLVRPLQKRIASRYAAIYLGTKVTRAEVGDDSLRVHFEGEGAPAHQEFDRILVAVGRTPNGKNIGADAAGVEVDERGYVPVDRQMRTNMPHIFAIGDIVGQPMLAHKATHEGKVAAEVCAGMKSQFDARVIPSVAYTDPEVAWVGLTEGQAKEQGVTVEVGKFPWAASGRALGIDRAEGLTKLLFDPETHRVVGAGIVGPHAGDLIAECALAIEMGCEAGDIGRTIHPHPTLSETVAFAAEVYEGTVTDLYVPKQKS